METTNYVRKQDNSDSEKNCGGDSVSLKPIQKIPQEIWELILDNLDTSTDLSSAYNTVHKWKEILYPKRILWMFDQILPLLLPHLTSKKDVLNCRLVCTRWCLGVDYFLTHNNYQRPVSSEPLSLQKTSDRRYPLFKLLSKFKLLYNPIYHLKDRIPSHSSANLHFNIIGRSLLLHEGNPTIQSPHLSNIPFLQQFGSQIYFLRIHFTDVAPADILAQLSKILELVPNLKKLDIFNRHNSTMSNSSYSLPNSSHQNLSAHVPKNLETLGVYINRTHLGAILLSTFISPKIQSLAIDPLPPLVIQEISSPLPHNLLSLSVSIHRNIQWRWLSSPDSPFKSCPISRFTVYIYTDPFNLEYQNNIEHLNKIVSRFKSTLQTFALQLSYETQNSEGRNAQWCAANHFNFFATKGLLELPNLRRLSFLGTLPISLNFILGVARTLEYLHLYLDCHTTKTAIEMLQLVTSRIRYGKEHCDLLKIIFSIITLSENWARDMEKEIGKMIYESNLWTLFPRLKVITVDQVQTFDEEDLSSMGFDRRYGGHVRGRELGNPMTEENIREWEFRRDVYEKLHEKLLKSA